MSLTAAQRAQNLQFIATAAVASDKTTGIPAELSAVQCILESGWLEFAPRNNPFGIKAHGTVLPRQLIDTTEWFTAAELSQFLAMADGRTAVVATKSGVPQLAGQRTLYRVKDWFAAFSKLTDAFDNHARLLLTSPFYRKATKQYGDDKNLKAFVEAIAVKYATSPTYAKELEQLISQANVQTALKKARAGS